MKFPIALLPIVAVLASCAGVSPTGLKPTAADKSLVLTSPVQYDHYYSLAGNRFFYTISSGQYVPKYEDSSGVYYEGQGECFAIRIESDSLKKDGKPQPAPHRYRCGIHVPSKASVEPRLYFYRDPEVSKAIFDTTRVQVVDTKGAPSTSPGAVAGGAVGMTLVQALDAAELKNLHFHQDQPAPGQIRRAME